MMGGGNGMLIFTLTSANVGKGTTHAIAIRMTVKIIFFILHLL
jgi:hypothetical protein